MSDAGAGHPVPGDATHPQAPGVLSRKWNAVLMATALATIAHWLVVAGGLSDDVLRSVALVIAALISYALAFMALIALSRAPGTWRRLGTTVGVYVAAVVVLIVPVAFFAGSSLAVLDVVALGAAGNVALYDNEANVEKARYGSIVLAGVIVFTLRLLAPVGAEVASTLLPFAGLVVADMLADASLAR